MAFQQKSLVVTTSKFQLGQLSWCLSLSYVINYSEWYCTAGQLHLQVLAEHYLRVFLNLALLPMDAFEECNIYSV